MYKLFLFCKKYIFEFLKVQAIVTLVSFPILVNWGIPLSLMTFVGNFIFSPILTIFLMISSLIFVTELLHIPNGMLIWSLDMTTSLWEYILSFGKKCWLIGFAQPNKTVVVLFLALAVLLVFRFIFNILSKLVLIAILVLAGWVGLEYMRHSRWPSHEQIRIIPQCAKKLLVKQTKNKTLHLIDNGLFTKKHSPEKFINFELKPYLIKNYGTTRIEKIILNKPSARSFRAAQELCNTFTIKAISVPYFKSRLTRYGWKCFFSLRDRLKKEKIEFERFKNS